MNMFVGTPRYWWS